VHPPVLVLHVPSLWQTSAAAQEPAEATQVPDEEEHVAHPVHALPALTQVPVPLQVCGWDPLHFTEVGVHTPVQDVAVAVALQT
jgi:hypothetical protein